jgi:C4-dicarboxylate-specific signal transduction histidine kinase
MADEPSRAENQSARDADISIPAVLETDRVRIERSIEEDMAALKQAMQSAVVGGQRTGSAEEQLRALEEMHERLQKLTDALRDYAKGVHTPGSAAAPDPPAARKP